MKFGLYPLFRPIFDWRSRLRLLSRVSLLFRVMMSRIGHGAFDWRSRLRLCFRASLLFRVMMRRTGHGADWGRGVEQLHVGVVGLVGLAVANTVAVDAVERSIVVYKQSPDIGRLA